MGYVLLFSVKFYEQKYKIVGSQNTLLSWPVSTSVSANLTSWAEVKVTWVHLIPSKR